MKLITILNNYNKKTKKYHELFIGRILNEYIGEHRLNAVRSVHMTKVKILPYRPTKLIMNIFWNSIVLEDKLIVNVLVLQFATSSLQNITGLDVSLDWKI